MNKFEKEADRLAKEWGLDKRLVCNKCGLISWNLQGAEKHKMFHIDKNKYYNNLLVRKC